MCGSFGAARGKVGTVLIAGMRDRTTDEVGGALTPDLRNATLQPFVQSRTVQRMRVCTDEWSGSHGLPNREVIRHGIGQRVDRQAYTNGLESFWSLMNRGYYGSHYTMSGNRLDRFVREFDGRRYQRELGTFDQMRQIVRGMVWKERTYKLVSV